MTCAWLLSSVFAFVFLLFSLAFLYSAFIWFSEGKYVYGVLSIVMAVGFMILDVAVLMERGGE